MYAGPPCPMGRREIQERRPQGGKQKEEGGDDQSALRPILVLTQPPMTPPMMHPMSALELTMPTASWPYWGR